jgi:hypothetical protein
MPMPPFLAKLRERSGHAQVLFPGVSAVVRDDAGQVLCLLRSENQQWSLPSGIRAGWPDGSQDGSQQDVHGGTPWVNPSAR